MRLSAKDNRLGTPLKRRKPGAIAVACARAAREGVLGGDGDVAHAIEGARFILHSFLRNHLDDATAVTAAIRRVITPMINRLDPLRAIRAEAHNANGDGRRLLTEAQVEQVVTEAIAAANAHERAFRASSQSFWRRLYAR